MPAWPALTDSAVPPPANAWRAPGARLRIALTYLWRHGRFPHLMSSTRFTELVQIRKLADRDPRLPRLADKVAVKAFVTEQLGESWVTPTLWQGCELPATPPWPVPFVVKSRHGANQRAFVRTGGEDWNTIRRRARRWMRAPFGEWLDEWLYGEIERGLLVEPFIGGGGELPVDYKLYVFGGRVEFVQVHLDRERDHRWIIFDRDWRRVSSPTRDADPPAPASLPAMIAAAETLAGGIDFVRADFYEIAGAPRFAELTFYPGSGLDPFDPPALDLAMGALWLQARPGWLATPARPDRVTDRG